MRNVDTVCFRATNSSVLITYVGVLTLLAVLAVGCSTAHVQQTIVLEETFDDAQAMQACQVEFLEFERSYEGGDVILDERLEKPVLLENFDLAEDDASVVDVVPVQSMFDSNRVHEGELVGYTWFSVPEPKLIEDPLRHEYCIESARSWCAPDVEDVYLSYLEHEEQQKFHAAVFPNFVSPVENAILLRGMQAPKKGRRGHYGLDLIPISQEGRGVPIYAVEDGVVVTVGKAGGYGYYTVIYHRNGLFSLYSHLLKDRPVTVGQMVERGEQIGQMGKSGNARGYHLHFELIDLREQWDSEKDIDLFVETSLCCEHVKKSDINQFYTLLFSKLTKIDPLPGIPGIMAAKKVDGKWVAVPLEDTGQVALGK